MTDSVSAISLSVVTIMPRPDQVPGRPLSTMGTKVMLSDGSELSGVTSITLTALPGDVWQANITVLPQRVEVINADAMIIEASPPVSRGDPHVVEITTMGETSGQRARTAKEY